MQIEILSNDELVVLIERNFRLLQNAINELCALSNVQNIDFFNDKYEKVKLLVERHQYLSSKKSSQ